MSSFTASFNQAEPPRFCFTLFCTAALSSSSSESVSRSSSSTLQKNFFSQVAKYQNSSGEKTYLEFYRLSNLCWNIEHTVACFITERTATYSLVNNYLHRIALRSHNLTGHQTPPHSPAPGREER